MIEETGWYRKMMRLSWFANYTHKIFFVPWFKKKLYYLGVMDYSLEEVKHIARCDIEALSIILDDKHFFLGDEVTSVDACAFALIANILHGLRKGSWPNEMINNEFPNLIAFYERIKALYWPDWDSIIASVG